MIYSHLSRIILSGLVIILISNFYFFQPIYGDPDGSENLPPGVVSEMCKYGYGTTKDKEFMIALQLAIDVEAPRFPTGIKVIIDANIPDWFRNNVLWWCDEKVSYIAYVDSLAFLLTEEIIPENLDNDNDSVQNSLDNCPNTPNSDQQDTDGDAFGDACDNAPLAKNTNQADKDNDGIGDVIDNCLTLSNPNQSDRDDDGMGDLCDAFPDDPDNDKDNDGIPANADNCPNIWNTEQTDSDNDGKGDECDSTPIIDFDGDRIPDKDDNCGSTWNADQKDQDNDGIGDLCDEFPLDADNDVDRDGVSGTIDNCPTLRNSDQTDSDHDGIGDACDQTPMPDADNDNVPDNEDNCINQWNSDQKDSDRDGLGDVCDQTPFPFEFSLPSIPEMELTVGETAISQFSVILEGGDPKDISLSCSQEINNVKCEIIPSTIRPGQTATIRISSSPSTVPDKGHSFIITASAEGKVPETGIFSVHVKPVISTDELIQILAILSGAGISVGLFIFERNRRAKKAP